MTVVTVTPLEQYFAFDGPDQIRLAGSRIGIEHVLYHYVYEKRCAEEIAAHFPSLTLEQVYATLLFYLRSQQQLHAYLEHWLAWSQAQQEQQARDPDWQAIEQRLKAAQTSATSEIECVDASLSD